MERLLERDPGADEGGEQADEVGQLAEQAAAAGGATAGDDHAGGDEATEGERREQQRGGREEQGEQHPDGGAGRGTEQLEGDDLRRPQPLGVDAGAAQVVDADARPAGAHPGGEWRRQRAEEPLPEGPARLLAECHLAGGEGAGAGQLDRQGGGAAGVERAAETGDRGGGEEGSDHGSTLDTRKLSTTPSTSRQTAAGRRSSRPVRVSSRTAKKSRSTSRR